MKYKTLLLGTAAVFAVAGSARAADLAVAESVEYVKVCDAYGTGYFYIPGSDTCLKISGDVAVWGFYNSQAQSTAGGITRKGTDTGATGFIPGTTTPTVGAAVAEEDVNWYLRTRAEVQLDAKSMTDWGMLESFVNIRDNRVLGSNDSNGFYAETAWAKIGGFQAGWFASTFDDSLGFAGGAADYEYPTSFDHDQHQGQLQWSTKAGPWGFFLSVEDPNDNPVAAAAPDDLSLVAPMAPGGYAPGSWAGNWPDIVAAVTGNAGPVAWKFAAAATDTTVGTGWGAVLYATYAQKGNPFTAHIQAAASNGAGALYGANINPNGYGSGTYWHVSGNVAYAVTSAFTVLFEGGYQKTPGPSAWEADAEADWTVGKGAVFALEYYYLSKNLNADIANSQSTLNFMFKRSFD